MKKVFALCKKNEIRRITFAVCSIPARSPEGYRDCMGTEADFVRVRIIRDRIYKEFGFLVTNYKRTVRNMKVSRGILDGSVRRGSTVLLHKLLLSLLLVFICKYCSLIHWNRPRTRDPFVQHQVSRPLAAPDIFSMRRVLVSRFQAM